MNSSHDDVCNIDFTHIDAVTTIDEHWLYFFIGSQYACYDLNKGLGVGGYPKPLSEGFVGLNFDTIDAVFNSGFGKLYFFSGGLFSRYDLREEKVDTGYPKSIKRHWSRLRLSHVDAVLNRGDGKVYFVSGARVVRYDIHKERIDRGYPKSIKRVWPQLGFDYLDGACIDTKGYGYFFCGSQYARYDLSKQQVLVNYPKPMNSKCWPEVNFGHFEVNQQGSQDANDGVSWIDGAFEHQGKVYFFNGCQYLRYDDSTDNGRVAAGYPQKIAHKFYGVSLRASQGKQGGKIKGCIATGNGKVQLFYHDSCSRFDLALNCLDDGYPKPISQLWPNLNFERIDGVFNLGRHKVYFICGNRVSRGDLRNGRIDHGYPKFISRQWPGLGLSRISAAFANQRGQYYFFAGNRYARWDCDRQQIDEGYPRRVDGHNWPGMDFKPKTSGLSNISGICLSSQLSLMPARLTPTNSKLNTTKQRIEFIRHSSLPYYQQLLSLPAGILSVWLQSTGTIVKADVDGRATDIGNRPVSVPVGVGGKMTICIPANVMNIAGVLVSCHQTEPSAVSQAFRFIIRPDKSALTLTANLPAEFLYRNKQPLKLPAQAELAFLTGIEQSLKHLAKAVQFTVNDIAGTTGCYHDAYVRGENMPTAHWQMDFTAGRFLKLRPIASPKQLLSKHKKPQHFDCCPRWLTQHAAGNATVHCPKIERLSVACVDFSGMALVNGRFDSHHQQSEIKRLEQSAQQLVRGEISGTSAGLLAGVDVGVAKCLKGGGRLLTQNLNTVSRSQANSDSQSLQTQLSVGITTADESWQFVVTDSEQLGELISLILAQLNVSVSEYLSLLAKPFDWEKTVQLTQLLNNMLTDGIGKIPDITQHLQQETHQALEVARASVGQRVELSLFEQGHNSSHYSTGSLLSQDGVAQGLLAQMRHDVGWFMCHFARGNYCRLDAASQLAEQLTAQQRATLTQGFHYLVTELEQLKDKLATANQGNQANRAKKVNQCQDLISQLNDMLQTPSMHNMAVLLLKLVEDLTKALFTDAMGIFKRFSLLVFAQIQDLIEQLLTIGRWHFEIPYYGEIFQFITNEPLDLMTALSFMRAVPSCFLLEAFDCDLAVLLNQPSASANDQLNERQAQQQAKTLQLVCRVLHCAGPSIASLHTLPIPALLPHNLMSGLFDFQYESDNLSMGTMQNSKASEFATFVHFIDSAVMQITGAFGGDLLQGDNPNELGRNIWGYQWTEALIEAFIGLQGAKVMFDKQATMQNAGLSQCLHQVLSAGLLTIGLSNFELQTLKQSAPRVLPTTLARCVSLLPQLLNVCVNSKADSGDFDDIDTLSEAIKRIHQSLSDFYIETGIKGNNPSLIG